MAWPEAAPPLATVPMPSHKIASLWLPVLVWAGVIFFFSSQPASSLPSTSQLIQKSAHVVEYAVLAFVLWRALSGHLLAHTTALTLAWLISVVYATSDELHQMFVPGRNPSLVDIGIDALGATAGLLLVAAYRALRPQHKDLGE